MPLRDWNPLTRRGAAGPPTPPPTPPALAAALAELDRLAAARPELAPAAGPLGGLLRAAFLAPAPAPSGPHADPELIVEGWRHGVPAFRSGDAPPALDPDDLRARALAVASALPADNPGAAPLVAALTSGAADPLAWALELLADRFEGVEARAAALGLAPALAASVLRLALLPVLSALSGALAPLRPEGLWARSDCPNCGGPPALAESRGLEQRRWLRCGLCAADWGGERLRCPFCGESDHRRLHYWFVEGEQDRYRLGLCDACGGRLRVVATLAPISPPGLVVAELATVHLDAADGDAVTGAGPRGG